MTEINETILLNLAEKAVAIYASKHPRPEHVTQKQAAKMMGLSVPTVRKMVSQGTLKLSA